MIAQELGTWCQMCGLITQTRGGLTSHVTLGHRVSLRWYYYNFIKNPCEQCGTQIPFGYGGKWSKSLRLAYVTKRKFCSMRCVGDRNVNQGKGRANSDGYIITNVRRFPKKYWPLLWPMRTSRSTDETKILEHRAVMAIRLGRPLKPTETVHHKNGVRADNRIANLELFAMTHGPGIKARTLVCPHCGKNYA